MRSDSDSNRRTGWLVAGGLVVVVALVALAYLPVLRAGYLWDDHVLLETGPVRRVGLGMLVLEGFWPDGPLADAHIPYYRPLTLLTFRANLVLSGETLAEEAAALHRTNLLLHLLACVLLARVARKLGAPAVAAVLASLVWGLAPRLTESVAWISGRSDVLAAVFGLGALLTCPVALLGEGGPRVGRWWASVSGVLLFGAIASKEAGFAFVLAILVAYLRRGVPRDRAALLGNLIAPLGAYLFLRAIAFPGHFFARGERTLGVGGRIAVVLETLARYAEMTLDYLRPRTSIGTIGHFDAARTIAGALLVVGLVLLVKRLWRAEGGVQIGAAIALASLLAVAQIVPLALGGGIAADRLLYLPLLGLALGLAVGSRHVGRRAALPLVGIALGIGALGGVGTRRRVVDYTDEVRFWLEAAETADAENTMARSALAGLTRDRGEVELACALYQRSFTILEEFPGRSASAHRRTGENLVACRARIGAYEPARVLAEQLARSYPTSSRTRMALGFARLHLSDFEGARAALERAKAGDARLATYVDPALRALRSLEEDGVRGDTLGVLEPVERARALVRLGRAPEAEALWLGVLDNPETPDDARKEGATFLVTEGTIAAVRRVVSTHGASLDPELLERARLREARHATLGTHLPRIGRLTK